MRNPQPVADLMSVESVAMNQNSAWIVYGLARLGVIALSCAGP